jgi:cyclin-dependent kinase
VTPLYRAPEVFNGSSEYSTAIDIWSIGCIFAELINGKPLFNGNQEYDVLINIYQLLGTPSDTPLRHVTNFKPKKFEEVFTSLDENGVDILSKMLTYDPNLRISASKALEHPFFN